MKELCRYDHVLTIMDAMSKYMETSISEANTMQYLEISKDAIEKLEVVERDLKQVLSGSHESKTLTPAYQEFEEQYRKLEPWLDSLGVFMAAHGKHFAALNTAAKYYQLLAETHSNLKKISNRVYFIRRALLSKKTSGGTL